MRDMTHPGMIDITLPLSESLPVWPGDAPVQIHRTTGVATVSTLHMSSHAGTHLDAPAHFFPQGRTVDQLPLETLIGPAWVAVVIQNRPISARDLDNAGIPAGVERLLLKTRPDPQPLPAKQKHLSFTIAGQGANAFDTHYIALDESAGHWLLSRQIRLLGVDAPSVDPYNTNDFPVHRLLLAKDIIVVENLRLRDVRPGFYRLICLPMPYAGGDGAPVRAVLEMIR